MTRGSLQRIMAGRCGRGVLLDKATSLAKTLDVPLDTLAPALRVGITNPQERQRALDCERARVEALYRR